MEIEITIDVLKKIQGEASIISQIIELLKEGILPDEIYINTDQQFGESCALTWDEIHSAETWPADWEYEGTTDDFTTVDEWLNNNVEFTT